MYPFSAATRHTKLHSFPLPTSLPVPTPASPHRAPAGRPASDTCTRHSVSDDPPSRRAVCLRPPNTPPYGWWARALPTGIAKPLPFLSALAGALPSPLQSSLNSPTFLPKDEAWRGVTGLLSACSYMQRVQHLDRMSRRVVMIGTGERGCLALHLVGGGSATDE